MSRYSSPPDPAVLKESTRTLTAELNALERSVGHLPLPAPLPKAPLTDAQRVEVCRELGAFALQGGYISMEQALAAYREAASKRGGR